MLFAPAGVVCVMDLCIQDCYSQLHWSQHKIWIPAFSGEEYTANIMQQVRQSHRILSQNNHSIHKQNTQKFTNKQKTYHYHHPPPPEKNPKLKTTKKPQPNEINK